MGWSEQTNPSMAARSWQGGKERGEGERWLGEAMGGWEKERVMITRREGFKIKGRRDAKKMRELDESALKVPRL